ncbi:hypothetical protein QAD02_018268 [Eretmocerus hayati]|uniref:Uncharacterized protein n=1 Tax=Eretmocerus hayati TaxID=131215 RepID=A0ACC2PG77_9HYME|nr:hypothetical protein QAD02_018268 [Eretmocerus hayati]
MNKMRKHQVYLSPAPKGLEKQYNTLFTSGAIEVLIELMLHFENRIEELYTLRLERKLKWRKTRELPKFREVDFKSDWEVAPVNARLQNRHLDLGDVSPTDLKHFSSALKARVQGIQVDFDDGHCPTWKNQIAGHHNIYCVVNNEIPGVPKISEAPILMFRPRAWNMIEHNMSINGKEVPGPIFDFGLLMFHFASKLSKYESGPFFYLSKVEGASEAKLWNDIFIWTQSKLGIPYGTIKACVLIENILSAFEMDQILYELRDHSVGLNCGVWDYAASIISKFGDDSSFVIPDRDKYVNFDRTFLKKYMDLVVRTCHKRQAHATGGMAAKLIPIGSNHSQSTRGQVIQEVLKSKLKEIQAGFDGFMIYDLGLVDDINNLWSQYGGLGVNQIHNLGTREPITESELLTLPIGEVTVEGLKKNIRVSILFIYNWLCGQGVFSLNDSIEDSATAEISRSQIWQWIRHSALIQSQNEAVTREYVAKEASDIFKALLMQFGMDNPSRVKLSIALDIFLEIVNHREFPEFITTYLNDSFIFKKLQANL